MRTSKGKFKQRKKVLSTSECFIYQLIESCLKYDLDRTTALSVINLILKYYWHLLNINDYVVKIDKMDYRNYRRYVNELMAMNPLHQEFYKQFDRTDPTGMNHILSKQKSKDIRQFENLLFLLSENDTNIILPYHRIKIIDMDDLVFRALIQLDKSYTF